MTDRLSGEFPGQLDCQRRWDTAMALKRRGVPVAPGMIWRFLRAYYGAELPLWDRRPNELYLLHNANGVVINPGTQFHGPAIVFHQVTFGTRWTPEPGDGPPTIGGYVFIGAGAKILGPVTIGNHVIIGAGAVVTEDVPDRSVVVGNPGALRGTTEDYVRRIFRTHLVPEG